MILNRDRHISLVKSNFGVYNWTTEDSPAANVLILLEKKQYSHSLFEMYSLIVRGKAIFPPKDPLGLIMATCLPALWFAPTVRLLGAGGSPSLSWAHPVSLLIHLEPELSQCHRPPIRSIVPEQETWLQPQVCMCTLSGLSPSLCYCRLYALSPLDRCWLGCTRTACIIGWQVIHTVQLWRMNVDLNAQYQHCALIALYVSDVGDASPPGCTISSLQAEAITPN